jgi:spore germination protein YaaH
MNTFSKKVLYIVLCTCAAAGAASAQTMTIQGISIPKTTIVDSGTALHVSAWVPYWRKEGGTSEAQRAILYIDTFSPFMYEVDAKGVITPKADLKEGNWASLLGTSRLSNKKVIPTIIWLKGSEIHAVLSDPKKRKQHIDQLVTIATTGSAYSNGGFDGIDIDYEGKKAETKAAFSAFLTELHAALRKKEKMLVCTIETRDANASYEQQLAKSKDYSNDYTVINNVCDVVRVMSYDQRNADPVLNKLHAKDLYMPVADIAWDRKVYTTLVKFIDPKKIEMGIPTYGHAYRVTQKSSGEWSYERMRSLTYAQAIERQRLYNGSNPTRGASGELTFTYTVTSGQYPGNYLAVVSDAMAVRQKIELAEALNLRGVALFALYGDNDPELPHNL